MCLLQLGINSNQYQECRSIGPGQSVCHCFDHDKHIKHALIERHFRIKWSWTVDHEITFFSILNENQYGYNVPTVIITLIKNFSYDPDHEMFITKSYICNEAHYLKNHHLSKKKLCAMWYASKTCTFPVAVHSTNYAKTDELIDSFNKHSASKLNKNRSLSQCGYPLRQVMHVDNNEVKMDLISMDDVNNMTHYYLYENYDNAALHFILLSEKDPLNFIDETCSAIWSQTNAMSHCILVITGSKCKRHKNRNNIKMISKKYNLPSVYVRFDRKKSVQKLFNFAVKYYWFCDVNL